MKPIDLTGQTFGRLRVVNRAGSTPGRVATWTCVCTCGAETIVPGRHLRTGNTRSCGCLKREEQSARIAIRNRRTLVGYTGAHRRVSRTRGPASQHTCADCPRTADDWSYDKTDPNEVHDERGLAYSLDPTFYVARCRPCHRRFDAPSLPTAS